MRKYLKLLGVTVIGLGVLAVFLVDRFPAQRPVRSGPGRFPTRALQRGYIPAAVVNSLRITEKAGVQTPDYPVQLARPFLAGEIPQFPQALIDGAPVLTQADVKQRYDDGSVKHAIISFLIPRLGSRDSVTVTFQNHPDGNNTPLRKDQMLAADFNFDARMTAAAPNCDGCAPQGFSARQALSDWDGVADSPNGPVWLWTRGPIATTAILADHAGGSHDLGWENTQVTTLARDALPSDTVLEVVDASAITAPMLVRLVSPSTTDTSTGAASEDALICEVDAISRPHRLTVCGVETIRSQRGEVVVTTSTPLGLRTGQSIYLQGVQGMTGRVNGLWAVTVLSAASFRLDGCQATGLATVGSFGRAFLNRTAPVRLRSGYAVHPNLWRTAADVSKRSLRPVVHATFWPHGRRVRVRFIGEIADSSKLQDQVYSLSLSLGLGTPLLAYENPQVIHRATTRWTKEFWLGGAPGEVQIDHNLAYLAATRFVYNFDTSKKFSFQAILARWEAWQKSPRDLFDSATMIRAMGTGGDNDHSGYYTAWLSWWLLTMDNRALQMATESADLGAAWLFHLREGAPDKRLTRGPAAGCFYQCDLGGRGRILSITDRRSLQTRQMKRRDRRRGDQPEFIGAISNGGWTLGMNHAWEPYTALYALTGDFWYLEEAWFWSAWGAGYTLGPASGSAAEYMRGPTGAEGNLTIEECKLSGGRYVSYPLWEEIRTQAWILRARLNTAFVSPDDTPEKSYLETLVLDAIAGMEGWHDLPPSLDDVGYRAVWDWARRTQHNPCGVSPLHLFSRGGPEFVQNDIYYGIDRSTVAEANGFGVNYLMFAIGRAAELGYPAEAVARWAGQFYIDLVTAPGSNPYLLQMGRMPAIRRSDSQWIDSWEQYRQGFTAEYGDRSFFRQDGYVYVYQGMACVALAHQVTDSPASRQAWEFVRRNILDKFDWSRGDAIKWAVVPRTADGVASAKPRRQLADRASRGR